MGEDRPKNERRGTADQPADRTELLIAELQDRVRFLEEANRANRRIIEALTARIPAMESPHEPPDAAETDGEPERSVASEVLGPKAILFRFSLGLLLVSGAAVFDAYMYDDPAFGPLVRVLPVTLLAAGAFGVFRSAKRACGLTISAASIMPPTLDQRELLRTPSWRSSRNSILLSTWLNKG